MKSLFFGFLAVFCGAYTAFSQATFTTTGSWETAGNWSGSNIGDIITEDVTFNNSRAALINNGSNYTIGNLTLGNSDGLTINTTGTLNVGASGTPKNFTAGNGASLTITGTLIIWGDLIVVNTLSLSVSGTLIVKGNIQMNNGASISVTGSVSVDGDFIAGNNATVSISGGGSVNVNGDVSTGNNANLTGPPGSFTVGGGCTQGSGSFCNSGTLPVELLFFNATANISNVRLFWATASELNSDYFLVEKSDEGLDYQILLKVTAQGNSTTKVDYETFDEKPKIGRSYYRLKQVDLDGKETVYQVVLVEFSGLRATSVYPSPALSGQEIHLELNFVPEYPLEVSLFDLSGRQMKKFTLNGNSAILPNQFSNGVYFIKLSSPEYKSVTKFIVCD
jgi:Secretion system C-terminal sorting domain